MTRTEWDGAAGDRWTASQVASDRLFRPLGEVAIRAARVQLGERVLDVGCGCGDTTLALAALVGSEGHVMGVDPSRVMLARARERIASVALPLRLPLPITLLEGDAATATLSSSSDADAHFDLVYSRFGLTFFEEPVRAFAHLRACMRSSDGRLAFVCWRAPRDNEWIMKVVEAIGPHLEAPKAAGPNAPGPFAFASADTISTVLTSAGFKASSISIERHDESLMWGASVDDAMNLFEHVGPGAKQLESASGAARERAKTALREMLTRDGVTFASSSWIVTADV